MSKAKISYHDQPEAFVVKIGCRDLRPGVPGVKICIYIYMYVTCIYKNFPQRTITYPTKREKEKHLQTCLGKGYVSSQEGISLNVVYHAWSTLISKKKCHLVNICSSLSSTKSRFLAIQLITWFWSRLLCLSFGCHLKSGTPWICQSRFLTFWTSEASWRLWEVF